MHKCAQEMNKPLCRQQLLSGAAEDWQAFLQSLVEAHHMEVECQGGNTKFSQHHEGRHAGQSGHWWLEEAATEHGAQALSRCIAHMAVALPVFGWKPSAMVAEGGAPQHCLTDAGLAALLRVGLGRFPMPGGKFAGSYTSMDLGRLCWTVAVLMGLTAKAPLGKQSCRLFLKMQGKGARRICHKNLVNCASLSKHMKYRNFKSKKGFRNA